LKSRFAFLNWCYVVINLFCFICAKLILFLLGGFFKNLLISILLILL
jgi:hypothetical protein